MNMPLTVGPHHGRPNLFVGASPGTGGSGFTGSLPGMPAKVVNQTISWPTNHTINYAYVVRKFRNGSDKALNIGQYVFIRKKTQPIGDTRLYTVVNIAQLNNLLYRCALSNHDRARYSGEDPGKILDEWSPLGVVATEVGFGAQDRSGTDQPQERLINATVRGRVSTFNLWGAAGTVDQTPLYLVLRRKRIGELMHHTKRICLDQPRERAGDDDAEKAERHCWLFEPYGIWVDLYPPDLGEFVRALFVGRISSKGYLNNSGTVKHTADALYDVDRLVTLPKVEVFVDFDTVY